MNILSLYSNGCILGILKFCLTAWGGNIRCNERNLIEKVLKSVNKISQRFENPLDFDVIFINVCQIQNNTSQKTKFSDKIIMNAKEGYIQIVLF